MEPENWLSQAQKFNTRPYPNQNLSFEFASPQIRLGLMHRCMRFWILKFSLFLQNVNYRLLKLHNFDNYICDPNLKHVESVSVFRW